MADKIKTIAEALAEVKIDYSQLQHIPEKFKTAELCLEAVIDNGWALEFVPTKLKTIKLCRKAVKSTGNALQYVPDEYRTAEICLLAVENDGNALKFVPEKIKTVELCVEAVLEVYSTEESVYKSFIRSKNEGTGVYIPKESKQEEFFEYIPENIKLQVEAELKKIDDCYR